MNSRTLCFAALVAVIAPVSVSAQSIESILSSVRMDVPSVRSEKFAEVSAALEIAQPVYKAAPAYSQVTELSWNRTANAIADTLGLPSSVSIQSITARNNFGGKPVVAISGQPISGEFPVELKRRQDGSFDARAQVFYRENLRAAGGQAMRASIELRLSITAQGTVDKASLSLKGKTGVAASGDVLKWKNSNVDYSRKGQIVYVRMANKVADMASVPSEFSIQGIAVNQSFGRQPTVTLNGNPISGKFPVVTSVVSSPLRLNVWDDDYAKSAGQMVECDAVVWNFAKTEPNCGPAVEASVTLSFVADSDGNIDLATLKAVSRARTRQDSCKGEWQSVAVPFSVK